ncbi:hypothetical protein ACERJO_12685 [Halalkalibacter sp. AB-rgal2]|uniref:hypothetical protein n=1 Tax=Halalkalibacter sp. AB-rgal2 TaxID=3242695 RepID=UPI00359D2BDD
MKILYKNRRFSGGAPLSLLEYITKAEQKGHNYLVLGEFYQNEDKYREAGIKNIIDFPMFSMNSFIKNYFIFLKYYKEILKYSPDIIHAITLQNLYFTKVIADVLNIKTIYTVPGQTVPEYFCDLMKGEEILVFSDENKRDLIEQGFLDTDIKVITNRMKFEELQSDNIIKPSSIKIATLISRLDNDKIKSVNLSIDIVERLYLEGVNIKLNILGDGEHFVDIKSKAKDLNEKYRTELVLVHGHVSNPKKYIAQSDIVMGKGRGIIEAIYYKRVCIVINENNQFKIVAKDNINKLKEFNFSGRNFEESDKIDELKASIETQSFSDLEYMRKYIDNNYNSKFLDQAIDNLYTKAKKTNGKSSMWFPLAFLKLTKGYLNIIYTVYKFKKGVNNE